MLTKAGMILSNHVKFPVTQGIRFLRTAKVAYTEHLYPYEEKGGTKVAARELGMDEYAVIKTLIMEDENKNPLLVLMLTFRTFRFYRID